MLSTLTDYNKTTSNTLNVWYETSEIEDVPLSVAMYVTRYASKQYSYVGLDRETAQRGADEKRFQYTYPKRRYSWDGSKAVWTPTGMYCTANITPQKIEGCLYALDIDVTQEDTMVLSVSTNPIGRTNYDFSKAFNWIGLEYDEYNEPIKITNIYRDSTSLRTVIDYTQHLGNATYNHFIPFSRMTPYDDWKQELVQGWTDGSVRVDSIEPEHAKWFRLMYYDSIDPVTGKYRNTWWSGQHYLKTYTGEPQ